jgi:hypothetical protein
MEEDESEPLPKRMRIDSSFELGEESKKQKQKSENSSGMILKKAIIPITHIPSTNKPNVIL